jgi:hypothetical protein
MVGFLSRFKATPVFWLFGARDVFLALLFLCQIQQNGGKKSGDAK